MMFLRCFRFDLVEGFRASWPAFVAVGVVSAVNAAYFHSLASFFPDGCVSCGSFLVSFCEGVEPPDSQDLSRFRFPVTWLLGVALTLYATLGFPCRDIAGFGELVIVRCGKRSVWWLSKCLWVAACTVGCLLLAFLTTLFIAAIMGAPLLLAVENLQIFSFYDPDSIVTGPWNPLPFLLSYASVMVGLALLQLTLSFLLRPSLAYFATLALAFVSALVSSPFLPCEYLMAARSTVFVSNGTLPWAGIALAIALSLVSLAIGGVVFARKDLVNIEVNE